MRKTFIILVLIAIFFNEIGYFVYYSYEQYQLKEVVKKELSTGSLDKLLEVIELDSNQQSIIWQEENKEFYLHGEMYDVKSVEIKNGKTYLHCLNDKKEEALQNKISAAAEQNNSKSSSEKNKHLLKLQAADYLLTNTEISLPFSDLSRLCFFNFNETILSETTEIITPPPRC